MIVPVPGLEAVCLTRSLSTKAILNPYDGRPFQPGVCVSSISVQLALCVLLIFCQFAFWLSSICAQTSTLPTDTKSCIPVGYTFNVLIAVDVANAVANSVTEALTEIEAV